MTTPSLESSELAENIAYIKALILAEQSNFAENIVQ